MATASGEQFETLGDVLRWMRKEFALQQNLDNTQSSYLLSCKLSELTAIVDMLKRQLANKSYLFYDFPAQLKCQLCNPLKSAVCREVQRMKPSDAHRLGVLLLQKREALERYVQRAAGPSSDDSSDLLPVLSADFGSERVLLQRYPALRTLKDLDVLHTCFYTALISELLKVKGTQEAGTRFTQPTYSGTSTSTDWRSLLVEEEPTGESDSVPLTILDRMEEDLRACRLNPWLQKEDSDDEDNDDEDNDDEEEVDLGEEEAISKADVILKQTCDNINHLLQISGRNPNGIVFVDKDEIDAARAGLAAGSAAATISDADLILAERLTANADVFTREVADFWKTKGVQLQTEVWSGLLCAAVVRSDFPLNYLRTPIHRVEELSTKLKPLCNNAESSSGSRRRKVLQSTDTDTIERVHELKELLSSPSFKHVREVDLFLSLSLMWGSVNKQRYKSSEERIKTYLRKLADPTSSAHPHPAALLATARILDYSGHNSALHKKCLQVCCTVNIVKEWMTTGECAAVNAALTTGISRSTAFASQRVSTLTDVTSEYTRITAGIHSNEGNTLMKMTGLQTVKEKVVQLIKTIQREAKLPPERRVPQSYHFLFYGNPGTGKTTVARLLGKLLHQFNVRRTDTFKEVTGVQLLNLGHDDAVKLFRECRGGVLFIDEAYALKAKSSAGSGIAQALLSIAEDERDDLTIIMAGYQKEMESELLSSNPGFSSRFPFTFQFEDYSEGELKEIFVEMCTAKGWKLDVDVGDVAARRVSRGKGSRSFGNARAVRQLFEAAYRRSLDRDAAGEYITVEDVIGEPIRRETSPQLDAALCEVERLLGMERIKESIENLVSLAESNYQKEMRGLPTDDIALNRVFLGNPGTGKTTMAKIYGKVLKALGYLSNGECQVKVPSDFIGGHVGHSEQQTSEIISSCRGKVLVIDEAYSLNDGHYGSKVIDTLVSMVDGSPGSDIAVILIGYEDDMKKMFREVNPGLQRRFQLEYAFYFDDYTDAQLQEFVYQQLDRRNVEASDDVVDAMVLQLREQRLKGNFGNMGAVNNLVSSAVSSLRSRDISGTNLELRDVGPPKSERFTSIRDAFKGLYNMEKIITKFERLKKIIQNSADEGKPASDFVKNYLFLGPPGTGKTTIARVMAKVLYSAGAISNDRVVIQTAQDLQGSYIGQTKDKVNEIMANVQGGVLLIDEAYELGKGHFSQEAMTQLIAMMTSPAHFKRTVVILAGYEDDMQEMLSRNEGMRSRFTEKILLTAWSVTDCATFFDNKYRDENVELPADAAAALSSLMGDLIDRPGWGSARDCITTFTYLEEERWLRGSSSRCVMIEDVAAVRKKWMSQRPKDAVNKKDPWKDTQWAYQPIPTPQPQPQFAQHQANSMQPTDSPLPHSLNNSHDDAAVVEEVQQEEEEEVKQKDQGAGGDDPILVALFDACEKAGYNASHDKRKELVKVLQRVRGGAPFPKEILSHVCERCPTKDKDTITQHLRGQISDVISTMQRIIAQEEQLRKIQNEKERQRLLKEREEQQKKLRRSGRCPMNYEWLKVQGGWRCAGMGHYMTDSQMDSLS